MFFRLLPLFLVSAGSASAALPAALAVARDQLRDQKSYSWEVINADPGPVAQRLETRLGTIRTVQQNMAPHVKGIVDSHGDILIEREWSDGIRLDTIITASGEVATRTPEGWMSERDILTAQAGERIKDGSLTPRAIWLRRADRPEILRPDQELIPLLKSPIHFEASGDTYMGTLQLNSDGSPRDPDSPEPGMDVTIAVNVHAGLIRDYELRLEGTRRVSRARVPIPVSEHRIVIITYVPVSAIVIPEEAQAKLESIRTPASQRGAARR
ncbi:MAG: hypothetical protein WD941_06670 [Opitutus sp.]